MDLDLTYYDEETPFVLTREEFKHMLNVVKKNIFIHWVILMMRICVLFEYGLNLIKMKQYI